MRIVLLPEIVKEKHLIRNNRFSGSALRLPWQDDIPWFHYIKQYKWSRDSRFPAKLFLCNRIFFAIADPSGEVSCNNYRGSDLCLCPVWTEPVWIDRADWYKGYSCFNCRRYSCFFNSEIYREQETLSDLTDYPFNIPEYERSLHTLSLVRLSGWRGSENLMNSPTWE